MLLKLNNHTKGVAVGLVVLAVALFAFAFRGFLFGGVEENPDSVETSREVIRHPLSGVVLDDTIDLPRVYGVMVENHFDAWPQSGLDQSALVMEAPVEGRIPRMIAFFSDDQIVDKIGPVRSARPYYIDWNAQFGGVYAHVGGSPEALDQLLSDDTIDINEFSNEWFFWRDEKRDAPHNVYTSIKLLSEAFDRFVTRFGQQKNEWESWVFKEDGKVGEVGKEGNVGETRGVTVDFAGEPYVVEWKYQSDENVYRRYQDGDLHEMQGGALIDANNVIVMETDVSVLDAVGRRKIRTVGEGNALVFQDGGEIEAIWVKSARSARLRFFDRATGEEIAMNAGHTWIEVIPSLEEDVVVE